MRFPSIAMILLLLLSMSALAFNIQPVKASGTIYIRSDGSIDPPDAPISTVDNVTYTLTGDITSDSDGIVVERNNTIIDGNRCTLQGSGTGTGIDLSERNNVTVKNMDINAFAYGLRLNSTSNNIIYGNNITANEEHGISHGHSSYNVIAGNNIANNGWDGIRLFWSSYTSITENNITNNVFNAISLYESSNNNVVGNSMTNSHYGIQLLGSRYNSISMNDITNNFYGIGFERSSINEFYHNNFIHNTKQVYVAVAGFGNVWDDGFPSGGNYWSDYTEVDADGDGIGDTPYIIDSSNQDSNPLIHQYGSVVNLDINLTYLTIQSAINAPETSNGHMIFVKAGTYYENIFVNKSLNIFGEDKYTTIIAGSPGYTAIAVVSDNVCISGFTMQNASNGVISHAQNVVVDSNLIVNCENSGLQMATTNNTIRNNFIENCGTAALFYGSNHTIEKNTFMNNTGWSIQLSYGSSNNRVTGNVIIDNDGTGIFLQSSHSNTISANTLMNNREGIRIGYSTGNLIFHNNLVNNTRQVFIDPGNINTTWDDGYPSGGNYWSDYAGVDLNHDGIGDIPYAIDANNHDNYPLMGMFSDFNATSEYPVQTICNSTISAFQFNGTAIVFKVAGEGGTTGFCRICIPTALMNSPYDVLVDGIEVPFTLLSCSNATQSYLYFVYAHSTHETIIRAHIVPPPPLAVSISPVSALTYFGQSITFTSIASGGTPPYGYQWYLNDSPVSGATSNSWTFALQPIGNYSACLNVTDSLGSFAKSNEASVTVVPQLTVSISPMSASMLVGQSIQFTSTASGGYPPHSYQWYLNSAPISGATLSNWTFIPTTSGIYYVNLKATDSLQPIGNVTQSETARITVTTVPVGGYSFSMEEHATAKPLIPYLALVAILMTILTSIKRKTKKETK